MPAKGKISIFLLLAIIIIVFLNIALNKIYAPAEQIKYGVTFSPGYATYLNLDWQKTYSSILDELKVKKLRVPSYWDILQPEPNQYDFSQTDYLLDEADKRGVQVVLVVGARQPRWPECHIPLWAKKLDTDQRQQKTLDYIGETVKRYKNHPAVVAWQVENEPLVSWFGESCDKPDKKFLQQEVITVKRIDSTRPVIITDSGEWSSWIAASQYADILGVSLYRKAFFASFNLYSTYPLPTWMYPVKSDLLKILVPSNQKVIISELQAEPWPQKGMLDTSVKEQMKLLTVKDLQNNINFAQKTGFDEMYLWGVEWWYYMAENDHPEYLEYAKTLFR